MTSLLADSGYFSAANVNACEARFIEPMLSLNAKRTTLHLSNDSRLMLQHP